MRDVFGTDAGTVSEGAPAADAPAPLAVPAAHPAVAAASAPVVSAHEGAPTLQQAVDKATAKKDADTVVAADPHATHHVKLASLAPSVLGSTATGAAIGMGLGGPPGAALGAGVGFFVEKFQIAGGPFGKLIVTIKSKLPRKAAPAGTPPAAPPAAT